jgi:O-antigen/teichoic acid export membrane protein
MFRKLISHTAIYGLSSQVSKVAGFLALPFITPYLTEFDYGVYGIIIAYASAIEVFTTLGLRVVLVNSFYKHPKRYTFVWRQLYGFLIQWLWLFSALKFLLLLAIMPNGVENGIEIALLSVAETMLFGPAATFSSTLFQIKEMPKSIAVRTAIFGMLTVMLNIWFIAFLHLGFMGWIYANAIVVVVSNVSYAIPLFNTFNLYPIFSYSRKRVWQSLKVSLPTVPHYYSTFLLNSSDRVVMERMKLPAADIGKYSVAYTVSSVFQSIGMATGFAIGPMMMKCYKEKDEHTARSIVFIVQALFLIGSFLLSLWLREIFQVVIRNEALSAIYPLGIIVLMAYNYRAMYYGTTNKLLYAEKTNTLWRLTFVAGILNVALNIILIPIYGYQVAALTTFATLMYNGYAGYFTKIFKEITPLPYYPVFWLTFTIGLSTLVYLLRDITWQIKAVITIVVLCLPLIVWWQKPEWRKFLKA